MTDKRILVIAEIGQAHDGSLGILHSYIDAAAAAGVDAVKFQMHIAEAESSEYEPFRVKFSIQDKTRYDYWRRMQFNPEQWQGIKDHCVKKGLLFICSPFSNTAVDRLEAIGPNYYKIGSGEVSNTLILEKIAALGRPVILSSGMSGYDELDRAMGVFARAGTKLSIMQCTTKYPSGPEDIGLNVISELRQRYEVPIGLSDHSGTIWPSIAAAALGAELLEVHIVYDKRCFGPDSTASLTISELERLVDGIRYVENMLHNPIDKNKTDQFVDLKKIFEKSLAVNRNMKAGERISVSDLEGKKPFGMGISASDYERIEGKKLLVDKNKWDFLKQEDIEE